MKTLIKILERRKYVAIKLRPTGTNHLWVKGKINNVQGKFILDTGASNSCVDLNEAEKFKLVSEESDQKASGAGSSDICTRTSKKNHLKMKKWNYQKLALVLLDLSHINSALKQNNFDPVDGIIGADVLEKGKAIIDYPSKTLFLKK